MRIKELLKIFRNNKGLAVAVSIILVFSAIALLGPIISPYSPNDRMEECFARPSFLHILGTNDIGQDILSELIYGTRFSLGIGIFASLIAIIIATLVGVLSGFFNNFIEDICLKITDFFLILPFLPMVIILSAYFKGNLLNIIFILGLTSWPETSRLIRSQIIKIQNKNYISNLKAMGASNKYIIKTHILREILPIVVYRFMFMVNSSILIESSLSFLGLGSATTKSWGTILYYAQARNVFLTDGWLWWILPPGICISLLCVSFLIVGYHIENIVNPKIQLGGIGNE